MVPVLCLLVCKRARKKKGPFFLLVGFERVIIGFLVFREKEKDGERQKKAMVGSRAMLVIGMRTTILNF